MEMKRNRAIPGLLRLLMVLCLLLSAPAGYAQTENTCLVRDNQFYLELRKNISDADLKQFIDRYNLHDLGLYSFLRHNNFDSLKAGGWQVKSSNAKSVVLSRSLFPPADLKDPSSRFQLTSVPEPKPKGNFGANHFVNKYAFAVHDSAVTFFLRGQQKARKVLLAGSFTNWQRGALAMHSADSGWTLTVHLPAGKYWYKFIVDGGWQTDRDNMQQENDGQGNVNSVYYKTNYILRLEGYADARNASVAGSFNNWKEGATRMLRRAGGWFLPVYFGEGTHLYKYVVDGRWLTDPGNPERLADGKGNFNSVVRVGRPLKFTLNGYTGAKQVTVAGTFNNWRRNELYLQKTSDGWALPYMLGPGTYEYKFIVDGQWMPDPANPLNADGPGRKGNSILVVGANYTFRLHPKNDVRAAFLGGDFNDWNPQSLPMRRDGSDWVLSLYLEPGKHRYKYFTDGKWILDPGNKLWEQNEFNTGNSVLWID